MRAASIFFFGALVLAGCGDPPPPPADGGPVDAGSRDAPDIACTPTSCAGETPHCDETTGDCVGCLEPAHCTDPGEGLCVRGTCGPCLTDTQCMEQMGLTMCLGDGTCGACSADTDCPASAPHCSDAACVECLADDECTDLAPECAAGTCSSCLGSSSCTPAQLIRELLAIQCRVSSRSEGETAFGDDLIALFCSGRTDHAVLTAYLVDAVEDGRVAVDLAALDACLDAGVTSALYEFGCPAAFVAQTAEGAFCGFDFECTSGRCHVLGGACGGTCRARAPVSSTCDRDEDCEATLRCIGSRCEVPPTLGSPCTTVCAGEDVVCSGGTCRMVPDVGAPCTGTCVDAAFCNPSRVCEARRAMGASCRGDTFDGDCADGLYCIGRVCSPPPGDGGACRAEFLPARCADGLRCVGSTCRTPLADGTSCTSTPQCALGSRCHGDVCRPILALGDACMPADACPLGAGCTDGRCVQLPDVGEPCFAAGCVRGVCRSGTCQPQGSLTPCPPDSYGFDLLDPCGANTSCVETASGWLCAPEGTPGSSCDGVEDPPCRSPDSYCGPTGTCSAACAP